MRMKAECSSAACLLVAVHQAVFFPHPYSEKPRPSLGLAEELTLTGRDRPQHGLLCCMEMLQSLGERSKMFGFSTDAEKIKLLAQVSRSNY
ncbi:hypothetical protein MHYP_G00215460 [Metynnis hypsauchen]